MSVISRFSGMLKLRAEERHSFRLLFLLSLITGVALSFYFVAVNTFLIQNTSVSNLPYAYIISGIGGVLLIRIYQARQRKAGIIRSYLEFLFAFSVVSIAVFIAYVRLGADPSYAVYLAYFGFLFNMPFTIVFALSFSAICARLYNLSQSKRLLALIGTGEIVASIIGYLFAPVLSKLLGGPDYLLPAAAICILQAFFPIYKLVAENRVKLNHQPVAKTTLKKLNLAFFISERFYLLIAGVSVFSVAAIYFVDYTYLISVRFMASYTGIEIAAIVGVFFSCVKIGELIFSFLSGHILSSKGARFSILLLPLLLVGCFIFAAVGGATFQTNPVFILCFIFLAKFVERVIRKAISTPAIKVLYQVTGPDRLRIEATIEGLLNQVATVLSGVMLLVVSALISRDDTQYFLTVVSAICFVIFLLWSLVSLKLYDHYKKKIWSYLTEIRTLPEPTEQETGHASGVASTQHALDAVVRYSPLLLNYISASDTHLLNKKLSGLYYSNDNFECRMSIIRYFQHSDEQFSLWMFKEFWDISDIMLKSELISTFNNYGAKPDPADLFYFEELCQQFSDELIYAMSAQNDLQEIDDRELESELKQYHELLITVLFGLLKVLYEPSAIQVIYETITAGDHQDLEGKLFAVELLDNTLNDTLKDKLIPIFEPAPFDQKVGSLQKFLPVTAMSAQQALKELLMKDFRLINVRLKEICLSYYYQYSGDKKVLRAFNTSSIQSLKNKAAQLLTSD